MYPITKGLGKLSNQNFRINVRLAVISVEDEKILQDRKAIANTLNNYFTDVTHSLGLKKENIGLENTLSKIVKTFRDF